MKINESIVKVLKPDKAMFVVILMLCIFSGSVHAQDNERAPNVIRPGSEELIDHAAAREEWFVDLPREKLLEAWQRLVNVKIPGVELDQRFDFEGREFFVSPDGDDENDGSVENPWRTLKYAVSKLEPGRIIYLREGVYYGPVAINRLEGSPHNPAAIRAFEDEVAVITYDPEWVEEEKAQLGPRPEGVAFGAYGKDGEVRHYPALITVNHTTHLEISGLRIVGVKDRLPHNLSSETGIWFDRGTSQGCRVLYNEIENTGHCGIKGGGDMLFEGNLIHHIGHALRDNGLQIHGSDAVIRKNIIINTHSWGVDGQRNPARINVSHNILGGNAWHGAVIRGEEGRVVHNIFYRNQRGGVFLSRGGSRNNTLANNVFDEPGVSIGYDDMGGREGQQPEGNVIDHNFLAGDTKIGILRGDNIHGENNIVGDPLFKNAEMLDFRPEPESPLLNAGDAKVYQYREGEPYMGLHGKGEEL